MKATGTIKLTELASLQQAAECLRTLAHPIRLRMVQMMLQGEFTVGDLAAACQIPSHMASEHLRMMQHCGFLTRRHEGRRTYYQVAEPAVERIMSCIESRFGSGSEDGRVGQLQRSPTNRGKNALGGTSLQLSHPTLRE
jgi:ArsR family transcriptional regulator, zinc-responsive transcriptional repressor